MLAILNFLNTHNLPIFQAILMILVSKFMVHRAFSDKTYLSLGLLSPLRVYFSSFFAFPKLNCFLLPLHLENTCFFQNQIAFCYPFI